MIILEYKIVVWFDVPLIKLTHPLYLYLKSVALLSGRGAKGAFVSSNIILGVAFVIILGRKRNFYFNIK